tara:strand:- start:5094 stop:5561 length:468 start_codon:yes stop_codon:yes gene_type:complete
MTDHDNDSPEYEVGYGKPPKSAQFKKGQSGNPNGRPPRSRAEEIDVSGLLDASVATTQNGKQVTMSTFEALFRRRLNAGLKGDFRALKWIARLFEEFSLLEPQPGINESPVVTIPKEMGADEFIEQAAASGMTWHEFSAYVIENRKEEGHDNAAP